MQKTDVTTKQDNFSTVVQNYLKILYSQSTYNYIVGDLELVYRHV